MFQGCPTSYNSQDGKVMITQVNTKAEQCHSSWELNIALNTAQLFVKHLTQFTAQSRGVIVLSKDLYVKQKSKLITISACMQMVENRALYSLHFQISAALRVSEITALKVIM